MRSIDIFGAVMMYSWFIGSCRYAAHILYLDLLAFYRTRNRLVLGDVNL
jgi:hypothetical protein